VGGRLRRWQEIAALCADVHRLVPFSGLIKSLVDVLRADLPVSELNDKQWDFWIRSLRIQVKEGTARSMARVTYNRSREFVRWLVEKSKVPPLNGLEGSAAKLIQ
jgi:hypothetical protein